MRIVAIRTFLTGAVAGPVAVKPFLFVKLATDAGVDGWGEAYALAGRERAIEQMILALGEALIGKTAPGPRPFRASAVSGFADKRTGIDFYCALSALEVALWDLAGKHAGLPVHRLLGGTLRERIPLYANLWGGGRSSIEQLVEDALEAKRQGFGFIKIYPMQLGCLDEAEAGVREIRRAVGCSLGS